MDSQIMKSEIIEVTSNNNSNFRILFHATNEMVTWRINTIRQKEPETIQWIDTFMPDDLFIDIGANIGLYSLYAAFSCGVTVIAFEPESLNYALLNKNIFINKMDKKIKAYPIAISDGMTWSELHISEFKEGGSCHNFEDTCNFKHEPSLFSYTQGCLSMSLDELIQKKFIDIPQHIKIDVDGIEHKILKGAKQLLEHPELKSILVEINNNLPIHREIIDQMTTKGFLYSQKQAEAHMCKEGVFKGVGNYIFFRPPNSEWEKYFSPAK